MRSPSLGENSSRLERLGRGQRPAISLIQRTRSLLQQSTSQSVGHSATQTNSSSPSYRNRLLDKNKKKKRNNETITETFELQVMCYILCDEFSITEKTILLKQVMINLKSDCNMTFMNEKDISFNVSF